MQKSTLKHINLHSFYARFNHTSNLRLKHTYVILPEVSAPRAPRVDAVHSDVACVAFDRHVVERLAQNKLTVDTSNFSQTHKISINTSVRYTHMNLYLHRLHAL